MSREDNSGCSGFMGCLTIILIIIFIKYFWWILLIWGGFWIISKIFGSDSNTDEGSSRGYGYGDSYEGMNANELTVTQAIMRLVGYVARGNDVITRNEINYAEQIIQQLAPSHREYCIHAFNQGKSETYVPYDDVEMLKKVYRGNTRNLLTVLSLLVYISMADGVINRKEKERIYTVGKALGFTTYDIDAMIREMSPHDFSGSDHSGGYGYSGSSYGSSGGYSSSGRGSGYGSGSGSSYGGKSGYGGSGTGGDYAEAMALLDITESTPAEEITRKYKRLIRKYHPDLIKAKGLPENMRSVYEQKTKEINEAYDIVKKRRGF